MERNIKAQRVLVSCPRSPRSLSCRAGLQSEAFRPLGPCSVTHQCCPDPVLILCTATCSPLSVEDCGHKRRGSDQWVDPHPPGYEEWGCFGRRQSCWGVTVSSPLRFVTKSRGLLFKILIPALMRYTWHIKLCTFKVYNVMVWYLHIYWNDYHSRFINTPITSHGCHFCV